MISITSGADGKIVYKLLSHAMLIMQNFKGQTLPMLRFYNLIGDQQTSGRLTDIVLAIFDA